jgi:hypothetical protein
VVAMFDPDHIIVEKKLGVVASDLQGLGQGIRKLLALPDCWRGLSNNVRHYYFENHSPERVLPQFEEAFLELTYRNQ